MNGLPGFGHPSAPEPLPVSTGIPAWTGPGGNVEIYRDGAWIDTAESDSEEAIDATGGGSYDYPVCDAGTERCPGIEQATF